MRLSSSFDGRACSRRSFGMRRRDQRPWVQTLAFPKSLQLSPQGCGARPRGGGDSPRGATKVNLLHSKRSYGLAPHGVGGQHHEITTSPEALAPVERTALRVRLTDNVALFAARR